MQTHPWDFRQDDDSLVLTVNAAAPDETEHLVLRVGENRRNLDLECWGAAYALPLETINLVFKPLAVRKLLDSQDIIVEILIAGTNQFLPLRTEIKIE
jgi:hypothetical protein